MDPCPPGKHTHITATLSSPLQFCDIEMAMMRKANVIDETDPSNFPWLFEKK